MTNHSTLLCVLFFMLMLSAGVVADEIAHVDLPEKTSTHTVDQSSILTVQMSEDSYSIKDGTSESNDQSTSISSVQAEQSEENVLKESEFSKSLNSEDLEPSFAETLTTSLSEQSVTQSVETATVVTSVTSSEDDLNGQKSVVEPSPDTRETIEVSVVNEVSEPTPIEAVQAEDQTVNDTQTKEPDNKNTAKSSLEPVVTIEPPHQVPDPGTGGAAIKHEPEVVKPDEEGLTFNEWTQKVLAEAEKGKQAQEDMDNVPLPPVKVRKRKNYASHDCGAKILTSNPEATNAKSVLNANKDEYMNNPCKAKKWFVIELCEPIQAHSVEIASLELFSSQPKQFKVFLSDRYPTKDWKFAGEFSTKDERIVQGHEVTGAQDYFSKYVRVELVDHFGDEHFCPLTMFRVLGIAVVDYEDDHHGINVDVDEDDDDDDADAETDEGSKNLFTSAKDTVISIVKKVLNVESDVHDININGSEPNATLEVINATVSNSATQSEDTLPCTPGATIQESGSQIPACSDTGKSSVVEPQPPVPGKTDSVIVVKLEDDEQIETTDSDIFKSKIPLHEHLKNCFNYLDEVSKTVAPRSCFHSKLCVFTFMVYQLCHTALFDKEELLSKDGWRSDENVFKNAASVDVVTDEVKTKHQEVKDAKHETKQETEKSDKSASVDEDKTVQKTSKDDNTLDDKSDSVKSEDITVTPTIKDSIAPKTTRPASVTSSYTEATQTVSSLPQTVSEVTDSETRLVSDSQKIDPSPSLDDSSRVVLREADMQATPSLSDDWEPHTKDVIKEETTTTSLKSQTMSDTPKVSHGTTTVNSPETPNVSIATEASNSVETVDTTGADEDMVELEAEADNVEQKPNTTIIDEKVVVSSGGNGKKDENLNLVRLTAMSGGKRESAIMRLSNRIKVLEQNVSLSSRFLEELSRRYKKQSEDMMKMLNKTLAQLNNVTVEADVKSKIHEDEMTTLEARLVNVTETLNKLTHSFNNLNQQVTDRQMIWTSIEIVIIIVIVTFLYFRRKQVTVPHDVKTLIEAMPAKPDAPLPQRRNSLSGPPTPSKEKALGSVHKGGGLQRFSSETALGSSNQEFLNPSSSDVGNRQGNDGNRKKKKKKHKGSDLKLFSNTSVPFHSETGSINSHPNPSQQPVLTNTQSTNFTNQSGCISSANLLQCSKPSKSCFGSMLSGWNSSRGNKARSSSFDSANDKNSPDDVFIDSQFKVHSGAKDNGIVFDSAKNSLGAKNGIKGPTKKPPLPVGAKKSPKLNAKSSKTNFNNSNRDVTDLEEKWIVQGHRRQKSLPKMNYAAVENIGPSFKKARNTETSSREKYDGNIGATKPPKRDEKSRSPLFSPESNDIQSTSDSAYPIANGHQVEDEFYDSEQMDKCYSLEKSQSDHFFTSSCGRVTDVEGYANSLNGHYSGITYDEIFDSPEMFTQNGADYITNDDCINKNQMPVNAHVPSNSKWKNIFGYFR